MITPDFLDKIIKDTEEEVFYIQTQLLKRISKRIVEAYTHNNELLIPSSINDIHKLMDTGKLADDIEKELIKELPNLEKEIKKAFWNSAKEISDYNTDLTEQVVEVLKDNGQKIEINVKDFESVGIPKTAGNLHMTAAEIRKLQQIYKKTLKVVKNYCNTTASAGQQLYISACNNAFLKIQSGISPSTAIIEAIQEASDQGITVVSFGGTREDKLEVAVARAVRTGVNKANSEICLTRAGEIGVGYVKVSSHLGARVTKSSDYTNHAHWQGKVYKLDYSQPELKEFKEDLGNIPSWANTLSEAVQEYEKVTGYDYPDFIKETGYGKLLGLNGVNCRHTFSPFLPGIHSEPQQTIDSEENRRYYYNTQKQRAMERKIRSKRKELESLKAAGLDTDEAKERIKELKASVKNDIQVYGEFCQDNNLSRANWRLSI